MALKNKLISILMVTFLFGCSDNSQTYQNNTTNSDVPKASVDFSTFSKNKKKFIESVCGESNLSLEDCSCMYDSMNLKLSSEMGENWMSKGIEDIDLWIDQINMSMQKCGLEYNP